MIKHYLKLWWQLTVATSQIAFQSRFGAILFLFGKIVRFVFFYIFLLVLVSKTKTIAGYSFWQIVFFYATFNLLDTLPQFFFRNVYRFREQVINGYYDNVLIKPLPALFHPLFGGSDLLDIVILIASLLIIIFSGVHLSGITLDRVLVYLLLLSNGFLIATALHIFVLGIGILTTAVDNTVMLYRDLTQMGRVPIEVYQEPLRGLITFVVPVGIMMTFPTKAMLGLLSLQGVFIALMVGGGLFWLSLRFWSYALKGYTSASG
ncbi:MAG TPA: ABC-2 family transporter protein [Patescibacteria group bacterium]